MSNENPFQDLRALLGDDLESLPVSTLFIETLENQAADGRRDVDEILGTLGAAVVGLERDLVELKRWRASTERRERELRSQIDGITF
ncbi:hypothetical protein [Cellulosimicrobium sp. CpK407]|uniref:hypothetical protein n=1 Tax=Cellulosimicrobium sp. CpK407 TaxID=3229847 RepID=UPI003F399C87